MRTDLTESLEAHAESFLEALTGCEAGKAWAQALTFQTFTDANPKPHPDPLARILHGCLDSKAEELEHLNAEGAGIFVNVNETDGRGRKKGNVRALRCWHADVDAKGAQEDFALDRLPAPPTMAVKTPGGWHLYWLAPAPMPCGDKARMGEHEEELKGIQRALARFGADPKVCQVAAVLRLPGYLHRKGEACLVELVAASGPRYTRERIREAFELGSCKAKDTDSLPSGILCPADRRNVLERAAGYMETCPGGIQGSNGSGTTFNAALKVATRYALTEGETLDLMMRVHNPKCEPPWSAEELRHKVADAWASAQRSPDLGCAFGEQCPPAPGLPLPVLGDAAEDPPASVPGQGQALESKRDHDPERPSVQGFEWRARGLYKAGEPEKTAPSGDVIPGGAPKWIAPAFTLPGLVRDRDSHGWRLLIAWKDLDGVAHEEGVPFELLSGEGGDLARLLAQGGLVPSPEAARRKDLVRYLCLALGKVSKRVRLVESLGWHGGAFILPDGSSIGRAGEPVRFAGELPAHPRRALGGTLEGWQRDVARYAAGNSRLAFGLACAFAGPLLQLVRPDGCGGFNLQGFSSKGKTTILECAASVWHSPAHLPTWRATSNGLEGVAASRNDGFLPLDELGQVDAKDAGSVAYMLANGSAKVRANRDGGNRPMKTWRLVFLSSGEVGLEDKLSEDGKRARAGQEVRVPDIPCPSAGMLEEAHGFPSMGDFAEHLKHAAREHFGHAARAFLEAICGEWERRESLQARLKEMEHDWIASTVPNGADPQVRRVGGRFALVAVAGELACHMGILPWPKGESLHAASVCFRAWLERRGHAGASEAHRGIHAVLAFIQKHGLSRFDAWGEHEPRVINRAGTRKRAEGMDAWDYFLTPEAWKEACQSSSPRDVTRACLDAGILEPDGNGKPCHSLRVPGHGKARYYIIRALSLAQYEEGDAA